jgi:hypothetical protein
MTAIPPGIPLPSIPDDLPEQPVIVADAVTVGWNSKACHALHEAGREPSKAAVAERGVRFCRAQPVEIDAKVPERGAEDIRQAEIAQHVGEQPADQEFQREIIDALLSLRIARSFAVEPSMDNPVTHRHGRGYEPVAIGRRPGVLADLKRQLGENRALDLGELFLGESGRLARLRARRFRHRLACGRRRHAPIVHAIDLSSRRCPANPPPSRGTLPGAF